MFKIDRAGSRVLCALDVDVSFAPSVAAAGAGIELAHEDLVSYSLFGLLVHACGVEIVRRRWKTYVCARYFGVAATIEDIPSSAIARVTICLVKSIVNMCIVRSSKCVEWK